MDGSISGYDFITLCYHNTYGSSCLSRILYVIFSLVFISETGQSTLINKPRTLFAQHKSGFLIGIEVYIREIASMQGTTFLGVMVCEVVLLII